MASGPITSWEIDGETMETVKDFILGAIIDFGSKYNLSNEHSRLISFMMDWLVLLAIQGTLKSLLQHHSSKASILWCSAFFIVQLLHPYMTTWKNHSLD